VQIRLKLWPCIRNKEQTYTHAHICSIFNERELTFTFAICYYYPSVCRLSVVCNVRAPYSAGWNFGNISMPFGTLAIRWHPQKILRKSSFVGINCCVWHAKTRCVYTSWSSSHVLQPERSHHGWTCWWTRWNIIHGCSASRTFYRIGPTIHTVLDRNITKSRWQLGAILVTSSNDFCFKTLY